MKKLLVGLCAVALVAGSLSGTAVPQEGPPQVPDFMKAYSIVPAGQEGNVSATELIAGDFGVHYADQLDMYASIVAEENITPDELSKFFHSMQFGPGEAIERTYSPTAGVTVHRDQLGIPHIYADSVEAASFALGYVAAEDRLFQMDVFRHAARGTLSEFVGPGADDSLLALDIATRREGYTQAEIESMFANLDERFGKVGATVQSGLQAYSDGINAYMGDLVTDPALWAERPVEYEATGNPLPLFPTPWTPADTLFLVVLQLRSFGETAGSELENAGLYAHLVKRLGKKVGPRVYADFMSHNEPRSYTSISPRDKNFHGQSLGKVDRRSFVIPDNAEQLAATTMAAESARNSFLASLGFTKPASNAILVSAKESKTGNPLEWGAPQVGYSVPQFFMDIDVHAPGMDFRGPAVPGASALIPLGRGPDYAWSLTTGMSDAVDTRVELLCRPDGTKPTINATSYRYKGDCIEMSRRNENFIVKPTPTAPGEPRLISETFYRTVHGPVFARGTVKGKPVAFVKERFFWMHEIDSIPAFYRWNTEVRSVRDFSAAAQRFTMSFNAFYADSRDIGYFHVGHLPERTKGVHPSLPIWGTGQWEWKGRRSFALQPKIVNPGQGWLVNWNNKPAAGWDNYDDFKWGSAQRVRLLADGMRKLLAGPRKATLAGIVDVAIEAATRDPRGVYLGPKMIGWARANAGKSGAAGRAGMVAVARWIAGGAHRRNLDRDETMDEGPALALFDRWYRILVHKVFDDELGEDGYALMPSLTGYSPTTGSSFFFSFADYLLNVFDPQGSRRLALRYCDVRGTAPKEACADLVRASFAQAVAELTEEQGGDVGKWTAPAENIHFAAQGAGSVPDIPWQNRGTHNHAVEIFGRRRGGPGG
ncbi:MAG TPA: penicillin acylase family protein [Actinomycetota bacterium]|nr:penicillin acylase family protein [Actinomycetota bacterium]